MNRRSYWICQIAGWGIYSSAVLAITAVYTGWRPDIVVGYALFFVYSIALTHFLRREIRRRDWLALAPARGLPRIFGSALLVSVIQTTLVVFLAQILTGWRSGFTEARPILSAGSGIAFATCIWTGVYVAVTSIRRYREARTREMQLQLTLGEAELRALRAQVNPHFLFNCLNTIRGTISENPPRAQEMVTSLANLFRHAIEFHGGQMVTLKDELAAVSEYLGLEAARLEERLRVEFVVSDEAALRTIPAMVLQTLVENAIRHGISDLPQGGVVTIRASIQNQSLLLEVENTGALKPVSPGTTHTGLANARERLRLLCGEHATLRLSDAGQALSQRPS